METPLIGHDAMAGMDPGMIELFDRALERLRALDGVLAAWHFVSQARGLCDQYSDVDPVFLLEEAAFSGIDGMLEGIFSPICDKVLLVWPEDFNSPSFKNFGLILKYRGRLYQFDVFFMNQACLDEPFCRFHWQGLGRQNLIFDRTGRMTGLLDQGIRIAGAQAKTLKKGREYRESLLPRFACYLFHLNMCIKYYQRADVLKLQNVRQRLYAEHAAMLLSTVPPLGWGSLEAQVQHALPAGMGAELEQYFFAADIHELMAGIAFMSGKAADLVRESCMARRENFPRETWAEVSHALGKGLRIVRHPAGLFARGHES